MEADDALTELGSVRRLMSEESDEESDEDSEESGDMDLDQDGADAMAFVQTDETDETELDEDESADQDESDDPEEDLSDEDGSVEIRPAVSLIETKTSVARGRLVQKTTEGIRPSMEKG